MIKTRLLSLGALAILVGFPFTSSSQDPQDPLIEKCPAKEPTSIPCADCTSGRGFGWWFCLEQDGECPEVPCVYDCRADVIAKAGDVLCLDRLPSDGLCDQNIIMNADGVVPMFFQAEVECGGMAEFVLTWGDAYRTFCCKRIGMQCWKPCD